MPCRACRWLGMLLIPLATLFCWWQLPGDHLASASIHAAEAVQRDRSPVDLVLTADEQWLFTANQTSDTVSMIQVASGKLVAEVPTGHRPSALVLSPDERLLLVTATYAGDLHIYERPPQNLREVGKIHLGFEPRGVAVSPDGKRAYVALTSGDQIAVVDLEQQQLVCKIPVGRWPRYLALSPDGNRLAVGVNGNGGVAVVDTKAGKQLFIEDFLGLNLGQMQVSKDGQYVYAPWMIYRHNPITPRNIRLGWVLASRIARVRLDKQARREAIALDPQGEAVSDPHGLAISPDEQWLVCAASGTHELLVYKLPGLPFKDYGGPGDHIDEDLRVDPERFYRIPLGGRPMFVRFSKDGDTVYVANYLSNTVQLVSLKSRKVVRTIELGGRQEPSLARQGEAIFYDGQRSLDQWYSCHSCHYEGHTNAISMDTRNDGRFGNFKAVLSLRNLRETGPWTWHGWQEDLEAAMDKSLTETMLGKQPTDADVQAVLAYLDTLETPPNPYRRTDGSLTPEAARGKEVFFSAKADCARCHKPPEFTRAQTYDVGTGEANDRYPRYNPPSLQGSYDRVLYLHDGRARSLREVLTGDHDPDKVVGKGKLSEQELEDLLAYLRSL